MFSAINLLKVLYENEYNVHKDIAENILFENSKGVK